MKKGKVLKLALALAMAAPLAYNTSTPALATDFAGKEDQYYTLCSSKKLSKAKQKKCEKFNVYLKGKSESLRKKIQKTKKQVKSTKSSITTTQKKITTLNSQISKTQKRIKYVKKSIKTIEKKLNKKQDTLANRIYATQSTTNSNSYASYLFGADSFSDFFSRVSTVGDVTSYENDLIDEINKTKKQLKNQKATLAANKASLSSARRQSQTLLSQYNQQLKEQEETLRKSNGDLSNNEDSIQQIAKNLADIKEAERKARVAAARIAAQKKALAEARAAAEAAAKERAEAQAKAKSEAEQKAKKAAEEAAAQKVAAQKAAVEAAKKRAAAEQAEKAKKAAAEAAAKKAEAEAKEQKAAAAKAAAEAKEQQAKADAEAKQAASASTSSNSSTSSSSSSSGSNNSSSSSSKSSDDDDSSSAVSASTSVSGDDIALKALSKRGYPYVWGASGPNSFDCSGLVWWAHKQCGISFGRADTRGLSSMGTAISFSNLQPGDVLIFSSNGAYSGIHHTGIYIGNGMMVHAPHSGATVSVVTVTSGYYRNQFYTARRLY